MDQKLLENNYTGFSMVKECYIALFWSDSLLHPQTTKFDAFLIFILALQKVPMGSQHMCQHYMGPLGGFLVKNRGLEG